MTRYALEPVHAGAAQQRAQRSAANKVGDAKDREVDVVANDLGMQMAAWQLSAPDSIEHSYPCAARNSFAITTRPNPPSEHSKPSI